MIWATTQNEERTLALILCGGFGKTLTEKEFLNKFLEKRDGKLK